jgi:hypothetical protein
MFFFRNKSVQIILFPVKSLGINQTGTLKGHAIPHKRTWFSPGIPLFSTNKTNSHDIAEILFKVALSTKT